MGMSIDLHTDTDDEAQPTEVSARTLPHGTDVRALPPVDARPAYAPLPVAPRQIKNPVAALLLSVFPGIGQIYNGQPAKALVFFFGFVGCIWMSAEGNPMPFALMIPFVYFYGLVDAWRSAVAINARGTAAELEADESESPAWGYTLVAVGVVMLLNNLGWLHLAAFARFWPLLLIAAGAAFVASSVRKRG